MAVNMASKSVNLSIKNVPETVARKLRERAAQHHRSLQGELMAILEDAVNAPNLARANATDAKYETETDATSTPPPDRLLERLRAITGDRGIDTTKRLTREQAHDRAQLRKTGV
jgi:plasmid stability protein